MKVFEPSITIPPIRNQLVTPASTKGKVSRQLPPKIAPNTIDRANPVANVELASQNGPSKVLR